MTRSTIICINCIVVSLMFAGPSYARVDPDTILGIWLLDEGSGNTTEDASGNGHDGTLINSPNWVAGKFGSALSFGSGGYVDCGNDPTLNVDVFSVSFWCNIANTQGWLHMVSRGQHYSGSPGAHNWGVMMVSGEATILFEVFNDTGWLSIRAGSSIGEWHHVVATYDGATGQLYHDGELIVTGSGGVLLQEDKPLFIGAQSRDGGPGGSFNGSIDEVGYLNTVLSPEDIQVIMNEGLVEIMGGKGMASNPQPADGATDVPRDVVLSWTASDSAAAVNGHTVYLSESYSDVNDGIDGTTISATSYTPPERLNFETTYYWRVDEVNAPPDSTVSPGPIWSFVTEPVGYPIDGTNITATASSIGQADVGPEKTIDGSGLDNNDLHSTQAADMWLSDNEPSGAWIQYEFNKMYSLHEMWVWNSNQVFEALFGFGFKDATIEYSTNGIDWTVLAGIYEFARAPGMSGYAHDTTVDFGGAVAKYVKLSATSNWGGVLPQYSLSEVRFFHIPVVAGAPSPGSGATDVAVDATLSWRPGRVAATHDVYLSTDQQAVVDGTVPAVTVTSASYSATLNLGSTYYWRVDEVNEVETPSTWQGDVWDFTTQEYLVVEDFEDYNDYPPYEIYSTWLDGYENPANGSQVGYLTPPTVETTIVHGGSQSMPFLYSNTGGATYSEATRTFAVPQDWTKYGVKTLKLWFYGTVGNTGQLYVKINGVKVPYDGDAGNLAIPSWQSWSIDLPTAGVNLQSITSLAIGIDGSGAVGTLYVDDIQQHPPVVVSLDPDHVVVPKTSVAPIIDGVWDAVWNDVNETRCLITNMINTNSATPENANDLSAIFKAFYDDNNFYIFVEVQDNVIDHEFSNWQGDGIEIYFDGDYSHGTSYDGVNDNQIRITVDDVAIADIDSTLPVDRTVFKVLLTNLGYSIEASFPLDVLQIYPSEDREPILGAGGVEIPNSGIAPNNVIGFEMQINDNDGGGGRETLLRWHSDDNNSYQNPSLFGQARLLPALVAN